MNVAKRQRIDATGGDEMRAIEALLQNPPPPQRDDSHEVVAALNARPASIFTWLGTLTSVELKEIQKTINTSPKTGNIDQLCRNYLPFMREWRNLEVLWGALLIKRHM